ncbi:transmembrane protein FAM155A [Denticeps clupeoides]|uniref:Uncharacterized protein n=1 Tax=Denticeps clupeoides TaxID=299321 RepID=A0AAY4C9Y6_9TELE|nr:transmembrane protein FAM155A-like [Denticeps clupeoides]
MTRGAGTRRQRDDRLAIRFAPRLSEKPCTDSERAQRWRLSLASLLFLTVLLSDHLWLCAEAKLTGTRDERPHGGPGPGPRGNPAETRLAAADADLVCAALASGPANVSALRLSFCDAYSLRDLFRGAPGPDSLNCSLEAARCSLCVQAYQRYDQHAQEKYEEFEALARRYQTDVYSTRTCMEECKVVYKSWLCSQYFQTSQSSCHQKILCERYCLEVQQSCPFILPDNDDLIHGGTPSFICTGLGGLQPSPDAECCDVRWDSEPDSHSRGTLKWTHPSCEHRNSVTTSGAPRLGHGRLKLCLLVLALLHTVATITAAHNATALVAVFPLEDHAPQEE